MANNKMTGLLEYIVMIPKCKTATSTTIAIERQALESPPENENEGNVHVAGGDHKGIVINKQTVASKSDEVQPPAHLCLQFKVFLVSAQTGKHTQESRTLQFWFTDTSTEIERPTVAQEFFKELVSPQEFPRGYVGFLQKIMKLLLHDYAAIVRIEVEMKQQLEEPINLPSRPLSTDETIVGHAVQLTLEKLLELIESAYPNPVTIAEMSKEYGWEPGAVEAKLKELQERGVVKSMEHGAFTRVVHQDTQIQVVKQMPTMTNAKQPTIAIITAQYCEKLAVDSMIENKETFVRYTTVGTASSPDAADRVPRTTCRFGESNVYTLGNIGAHRIVCTKLPTVGHTREAMTAAGNTTTRLLGTFQKVDFVFLVGIGGGVPHYTDYKKHVRLGDVVISHPTSRNENYIYLYCDGAKRKKEGCNDGGGDDPCFETKEYWPTNLCIQEIVAHLKEQSEMEGNPSWKTYLREGLRNLSNQTEHDFRAPPADSDKLYMAIGERDVIEVEHPTAPSDTADKRMDGCPRIHLAPVASGRHVARDDVLRQRFAARYGVLAFDAEMDAVVESILGNCRESFAVIRGISDYRDGSRTKEWQAYASLAAASVAKAVICAMDPPTNV